jgi:hypothetical protein
MRQEHLFEPVSEQPHVKPARLGTVVDHLVRVPHTPGLLKVAAILEDVGRQEHLPVATHHHADQSLAMFTHLFSMFDLLTEHCLHCPWVVLQICFIIIVDVFKGILGPHLIPVKKVIDNISSRLDNLVLDQVGCLDSKFFVAANKSWCKVYA